MKPSRRRRRRGSRRRAGNEGRRKEVTLSKTHEMVRRWNCLSQTIPLVLQGQTVDAESWSFSEQTESEDNASKTHGAIDFLRQPVSVGGLARLDARYFRPLFVRKFTRQVGTVGVRTGANR